MFPEIDYNFDQIEEVEEEPSVGRTPLFDFKTNKYVVRDGKIIECTKEEAIRQWVAFLIKTRKEKYDVYGDFGTYIENYIGGTNVSFISSEIRREIEEGCKSNAMIESIEDFNCEVNDNVLHVSLTVKMIDESEVIVNVEE